MSTISENLKAAMDYAAQPSAVKQSFYPNSCCGKSISKALRSGALDTAATWECSKCGCEWRPTMIEGLRFWEPHPIIQVWRRR